MTPALELRSIAKLREECTPEIAKGAAHALASWILAFARSGDFYGFPFDMFYWCSARQGTGRTDKQGLIRTTQEQVVPTRVRDSLSDIKQESREHEHT